MTNTYTVDPTRFHAEGAVLDLPASARLPHIDSRTAQPNVELRWTVRRDLGMPSTPFEVWARPHPSAASEQPLVLRRATLMFLFGYSLITWPVSGSVSNVSVDVTAPVPCIIFGFRGEPVWNHMNASAAIAAGTSTVQLSAPALDGLMVPPGANVTAARGTEHDAMSRADGWALIETIGIPTERRDGLGQHVASHTAGTRVAMPSRQDYMITARWDTRIDAHRALPLDLAAIVPAPDVASATPGQEPRFSLMRPLASGMRLQSLLAPATHRESDRGTRRPEPAASGCQSHLAGLS